MEVLPPLAILNEPLLDVILRDLNNGKPQVAATAIGHNGDKPLLRRLTNTARDFAQASTLREEIERLAGTVLTIDRSFYKITRVMRRLTKKVGGDDRLSSVCSGLLTHWTQHHREYRDLLAQSREVAGAAQGVVDEFRTHVLPSLRNDAVVLAEKQRLIAHHLKAVERNASMSAVRSRAFQDFSETLKTYVSEFSDEVESLGLDDQSEKVRSLSEGLRDAKTNMNAINEEIKKLVLAVTGKVPITGIAIWLATMAPGWWAVALAAGIVGTTLVVDPLGLGSSGKMLCEAVMRRHVAAATYDSIKLERDKEQINLHQIHRLQSALNICEPAVQETCEKLSIFVSVWNFMTADLRQIQHALGFAERNITISAPDQFTERIEDLERLYQYLSQALRHYQVLTQV